MRTLPNPSAYEAEHAALALLSIDDVMDRAVWFQRLYGKRYADVFDLLIAPVLAS